MSRASLASTVLLLLAVPVLAAGDAERIPTWTAPPFWTPPSPYEQQERTFGREPLPTEALAIEALPSSPMPFMAITPCRLADTRSGSGFSGSYGPPSLGASGSRTMTITGQCGIASGALAVSFNVTVTNTLGAGFILAFPAGGSAPTVSTLNYVASQTVANAAIVPLSTAGAATFVAGVSGTDLIVDVNGYYAPVNLVNSVNSLTGDVTLAQGTNVTITPSGNTLTIASSGSSAVSSVFGRTGAVTATSGDYTGSLVTNTPAGTVAATTVQAAVNELDTEKSATSHAHTSTGVTGLTPDRVTFGGATGVLTQSPALTWTESSVLLGVGGSVEVTGLLRLAPSSSTGGQLQVNGLRFLHGYGSQDTFLGEAAGNFTTTGNSNTGVGYHALNGVTSGTDNTGVGLHALAALTTGTYNSAFGRGTLLSNTIGSDNTAVGRGALTNNTIASRNTALGAMALQVQSHSNGGVAWNSENTAVGYQALQNNQPSSSANGSQNTAVGANSLISNTTGSRNAAIGHGALYSNTSGDENAALGVAALYANSTANRNTAVGYGALYSQSFSNGGAAWDSENTAVGYEALSTNQPTSTANGYQNTAVGAYALELNTTGHVNVAVGHGALGSNTIGSANVAIGRGALHAATTDDNTAVGDYALGSSVDGHEDTAIGGGAT